MRSWPPTKVIKARREKGINTKPFKHTLGSDIQAFFIILGLASCFLLLPILAIIFGG